MHGGMPPVRPLLTGICNLLGGVKEKKRRGTKRREEECGRYRLCRHCCRYCCRAALLTSTTAKETTYQRGEGTACISTVGFSRFNTANEGGRIYIGDTTGERRKYEHHDPPLSRKSRFVFDDPFPLKERRSPCSGWDTVYTSNSRDDARGPRIFLIPADAYSRHMFGAERRFLIWKIYT